LRIINYKNKTDEKISNIMKLYKSILDRANNPTKEEKEKFKKLLKKYTERKKIKTMGG
jgi:preprotein translocase subunit Sss1